MKGKNWPIAGANSVNQSKTEVNTGNGRENMCEVFQVSFLTGQESNAIFLNDQ